MGGRITSTNNWDLVGRLTAGWLQYPQRPDRDPDTMARLAAHFRPEPERGEPLPVAGVGLIDGDRLVVLFNRRGVAPAPERIRDFYGYWDDEALTLYTGPFRPCLAAGDSAGFGSNTGATGTAGAIVKDVAGVPHILSCNHVIAETNGGVCGADAVWGPGSADGGTVANRVGVLHDYEALDLSGVRPNQMDAAVARPDRGVALSAAIPSIGTVSGTNATPAFNTAVEKFGKATSHTVGDLVAKTVSVLVAFGSATALFTDQYGVAGHYGVPFASDGDSGSLVVEYGAKRAVGLVFAVSGQGHFTIASPIDPIAKRFGLCF
jgi:hypothetical protein